MYLTSRSQKQWSRIGVKKRAGVATPLFSLYSKTSLGIGEIPDLKLLVDWCVTTGMSLIQLLPLNDAGFDFRPYDAQSMFALDPMYLSLREFSGTEILRKKFPAGQDRVNYGIKKAKLDFLWKIFKSVRRKESVSFLEFQKSNERWLSDYALYKVIWEENGHQSWETWPSELKQRELQAMECFQNQYRERIHFNKWLQWQLFQQMTEVKKYASSKSVLLMGDMPFLVSRNSADVWSHQNYFKLDLAAGAPPDMYCAKGQRWGMPPYDWREIARNDCDYLIQKLRYAQNFYDAFRIDHSVGMFRLWSIPASEPLENAGLHGFFDPKEEPLWEEHGRKILSVILENTEMLPCAEDLGVIPSCSFRVLEEFGIPGTDVQRWTKDWGKTYDFKTQEAYRINSMAVISTHDTSSFRGWWEFEAGTVDEELFKRICASRQIDYEAVKGGLFDLEKSHHGRLRWKKEIRNLPQHPEIIDLYLSSFNEKEKFWRYVGFEGEPEETSSRELIRRALEKISSSASIFNIQLLQDWLALDERLFQQDAWDYRINVPGTTSGKNWSLVIPFSLEEMNQLKINETIRDINVKGGR